MMLKLLLLYEFLVILTTAELTTTSSTTSTTTATTTSKLAVCQAIYGIRIGPSGSVEQVLDAVRCKNAERLSDITSFLGQLRTQLPTDSVLDMEVVDSTLPALESGWLAGVSLRRLSVQQSGLETVSPDAFAGQENVLEELDLSRNHLEEIPSSIQNLTALTRLDLSRNRIRSFPPGAVFFHLLKLRHLDLDGNQLDYLDSFLIRPEVDGLPLSIFNLEPLRDHVESIRLAGNNLTAFPDQFSRSFPRLRQLDLSSNNFLEIPSEAFAQMPQLRRLNLDDNRLTSVPQWQLPPTLDVLSVKGNPLRCDCSATWLWHWLHQGPTTTGLHIDDCRNEPWAGRHLSDLPADFCLRTPSIETITHLVDVDVHPGGPDTINVTFLLPDTEAQVRWTIHLRQFGAPAEPEASWSGDLSFPSTTHVLEGLLPSTGYEVCVRLPGSGHCWEVVTPAEVVPPYPVAEVAVAASVSSTSTFIVVVLVCCYCPRFKSRKRAAEKKKQEKKKKKKKTQSREEEKKGPIFSITPSTGSSSWPDGPDGPVRFSTFRVQESEENTFQATCAYLKQRALDPGAQHQRPGRPLSSVSYFTPLPSGTVYSNATYGLTTATADPYKYCTWRPNRRGQRCQPSPAPLQRWTSYPDFLANSSKTHCPVPCHPGRPRSAMAVPVYSSHVSHSWPASYHRPRFYWSAAPNVEMQF